MCMYMYICNWGFNIYTVVNISHVHYQQHQQRLITYDVFLLQKLRQNVLNGVNKVNKHYKYGFLSCSEFPLNVYKRKSFRQFKFTQLLLFLQQYLKLFLNTYQKKAEYAEFLRFWYCRYAGTHFSVIKCHITKSWTHNGKKLDSDFTVSY